MRDKITYLPCHICKKEAAFVSEYGDVGGHGPYIELKHVAKGINNIKSLFFHVDCCIEQAGEEYK